MTAPRLVDYMHVSEYWAAATKPEACAVPLRVQVSEQGTASLQPTACWAGQLRRVFPTCQMLCFPPAPLAQKDAYLVHDEGEVAGQLELVEATGQQAATGLPVGAGGAACEQAIIWKAGRGTGKGPHRGGQG